MSKSSNKLVNPNAREAMNKFKMEAAGEVGVNLKQGYNGELTSKQAGSIGGQMVKKMIQAYAVSYTHLDVYKRQVMDSDKISGIVIENKSGRSVIECGCVIDCSGDSDIAWLSGADTALHEGGNGLASWYYYKKGGDVKLKMFGLADLPPSENPQDKKDDPYGNVTVASLTSTRFSGVDGPELSRAVIEAHGKMFEDILEHQKSDPEYVPVTISTIPLVRMSRRLCGEYTLDDSENRTAFSDSIGLTGDWRRPGPCYEIPYRTLYTNKVKNLLCEMCIRDSLT